MFTQGLRKLSVKYSKFGFALYFLSVQYFVIQILVASRWSRAYSVSKNTISDLGNTKCGEYGSRFVCSPWHSLMNVSFIVLGITMFTGSILVYHSYKRTRSTALGFGALALGGIGSIVVGLFPENTISTLHVIGATLPFLVGNIGVLILSLSLKQVHKALRLYALIAAIASLCALPFFVSGHYLDLGSGGIERIAGYPQPIFLILLGAYGLLAKNKSSR